LTNLTDVCIRSPEIANKYFDCQGHAIKAKETQSSEIWGIIVYGKNITIKNCEISGFRGGINLISSSNNTLINNTIHLNDIGIRLYGNSNYNNITGNKIFNNIKTGILIDNCACVKFTCSTPIGGSTVSCYCTSYNCSDNFGNSNNTIEDNEILNNKIGIFSTSSNSIINRNAVCGNTQLDFNSSDWLSSYGSNNTCSKPDGWNDTEKGTTGCTYSCCVPYDLDNNHVIDIFDVVTGLEYLSDERNQIFNEECSARDKVKIDFIDLLTLISKIGADEI